MFVETYKLNEYYPKISIVKLIAEIMIHDRINNFQVIKLLLIFITYILTSG